ncbi:hypothetical protein B9X78_10715 [Acinetobacter pittii]|nr:hypothetical protein B9X78_10715 [Acinetobacter pittii]
MKNLFKLHPTQSHLIPQNPTIISSLLYIYIIRYQDKKKIYFTHQVHQQIEHLRVVLDLSGLSQYLVPVFLHSHRFC